MSSTTWRRVTKAAPCPICGRGDWCLRADHAAICARVSDGSVKRCGEAGYLHRLNGSDLRHAGHGVRTWRVLDLRPGRNDLPMLATKYQTAVNPARLDRLADDLGVTAASLRRLRIGWAFDAGAWAFPMTDAGGRVLGIRLRLPNGRKLAVSGGREGLFVPSDLAGADRLLICEGPTDTAALLDLGLDAVGRPSCTGGVRLLVDLVKVRMPGEVVIVADGDEPGRRGAESLAAVLVAYCPAVKVIVPPDGIKDARAWKQAGATAAKVQVLIDAAPIRKLSVTAAGKGVRHGC